MTEMNKDLELHLRRAVLKLEATRNELKAIKHAKTTPIAIVGMSCRFPGGANSPDLFWEKLATGQSLIQDIPHSRWTKEEHYSRDRKAPGKMYTHKAGIIDEIDCFDAGFFNISRREALLMDPQQRLLLEETWRAFEYAGIAVNQLKGSDTAVYFGCGSHDYANHLGTHLSNEEITAYYGTGNSSSLMAGRVAYFFDFHGEALTLDTSCSSSLVAVHLACQALRNGKTSLAVVGGVNAILTPAVMINFCKANMLAEDGLCKTFDDYADGYARGEGVGVVLLKRLDDALRDNDTILACIKGHGVNHDGASSGLTSPNGEAQVQLLRDTLTEFAISPDSIDYVEAHGTGTPLGDPIEVNALNQIFSGSHSQEHPLYLGSVKTNIGHLEAGAGIAGLIKVILSLMHQTIPAHLNLKQLNSLIEPKKIPLVIPKQTIPWDEHEHPRRASVSSFGFSGTNAFIVLEEHQPMLNESMLSERDWHPVLLSAKTKESLLQQTIQLQEYLTDSISLPDLCYTLSTGRVLFEHTLLFICQNHHDLREKLVQTETYYQQLSPHRDALLVFNVGSLNKVMQEQLHEVVEGRGDELIHQFLSLLSSWNVVPDYLIGLTSLPDELADTIILNLEQLETINEPFIQVDFFSAKSLSELAHRLKHTNVCDGIKPFWLGLIEALLSIQQYSGSINWQQFDAPYARTRLVLPTYPFARKRYWYETQAKESSSATQIIMLTRDSYLQEHSIYGQCLFPAAGFIALMYDYLVKQNQTEHIQLHHFKLLSALILDADEELVVQLGSEQNQIEIYQQSPWKKLAEASWSIERKQVKQSLTFNADSFNEVALPYETLRQYQIDYGPHFQNLLRLQSNGQQVIAQCHVTWPNQRLMSTLDAAFQSLIALLVEEIPSFAEAIFLPISFASLYCAPSPADHAIIRVALKEKSTHHCVVDIEICDERERLLYALIDYRAQKVRRSALCDMEHLYYQSLWMPTQLSGTRLERYQLVDWRGLNSRNMLDAFSFIKPYLESSTLPIVVLLDRAWQVNGESLNPAQRFLAGLIRTIRAEYPQHSVYCVDCGDDSWDVVVGQPSDIAVRENKVFQEQLHACPLGTLVTTKESCYVFLGGSSKLCLLLAQRLLHKNPAVHIVLIARHTITEQLPQGVSFIQGDLTQTSVIHQIVKQIGVPSFTLVHAAGMLNDAAFSQLTVEQIKAVIDTKLTPLRELLTLCQEQQLTINQILCLSSVAAWFGSHGQAAYAAANAYLDGWMQQIRQQGIKATSVALSPVHESKMAKKSALLQRMPQVGVSLHEAVTALLNALEHQMPVHYAVMNQSLIEQLRDHPLYQHLFALEAKKSQPVSLVEMVKNRSRHEAEYLIKSFLLHEIGRVLQLQANEYDERSGFFDLGMDSIMALELFDVLQKSLGNTIKLSQTVLFDKPSIKMLTDYLVTQLHSQLQASVISNPSPVQGQIQTKKPGIQEPIAIVGMACRLPGKVHSAEAYWQLLCEGRDTAIPIPKIRWNHDHYYDPQRPKPGKIYTRNAHFIEDYAQFDAEFFGITPKELESMDPQHRLLIELTHQAFEHALIPSQRYHGSNTGVFIGHFTHDYGTLLSKYAHDEEINAYTSLGNSASTISGRISYLFGFQGPSFPINTACSSSLTAAHLACQSLGRGECNLAVVGGVNLILSPEIMINICQSQMLSDDGRCHSFAQKANGYGRGEGAGILLLKRLSDALADKDNIEAVIVASGTNQDGASSALSVPNGQAQQALLSSVLNASGLTAEEVDYIEAHGTGTALGDPIEVNAINEVYQHSHSMQQPLYLSTVKANIGHLEAAAGVAGLIKVVQCLKHKSIPPHVSMEVMNSAIDLEPVPLVIPRQLTALPTHKQAVIGISSFGFSGSNAHLMVQEAPKPQAITVPQRNIYLIKLSAKSGASLRQIIVDLLAWLDKNVTVSLADLSYSLNVGRNDYDYRCVLSAHTLAELRQELQKAQVQEFKKPTQPLTLDDIITGKEHQIADAYLQGQAIDWSVYEAGYERNRILLPHYPLDKKEYLSPVLQRLWANNSASLVLPMMYALEYQAKPLATLYSEEPSTYLLVTDDPDFASVMKDLMAVQLLSMTQELPTAHGSVVTLYDARANTIERSVRWLQTYQVWVKQSVASHQLYYLTTQASGQSKEELNLDLFASATLLRALNFEYATTRYKHFDYDSHLSLPELGKLLNQEIMQSSLETEFNYYHGQRWVPRLVPVDTTESVTPLYVSSQRSYIITGGQGGLGQALADYLSHLGAGQVHLLSRRLTHSQQANIIAHQVDVTNKMQLVDCLEMIQNSAYPIAGVFHLAGVDDRADFTEYEWPRFANAIAAKVDGARYLHEFTQNLSLDYFVLFSSIASAFGSAKQGPYVLANAYLDALAQYRRMRNLPAQSIQWGPWAVEGLVGSSVLQRQTQAHLLKVSVALNALAYIVQRDLSQIVVAQPEFIQFLTHFFPKEDRPSFLSQLNQQPVTLEESELIKELKQAFPEQYSSILEEYLMTIIRQVTHADGEAWIDPEKSFFDLGIDSLMAVDIAELCRIHLAALITISPTLLFDMPNIRSLAEQLGRKISNVLNSVETLTIDKEIEHYSVEDIEHMSLDELDAIINGASDE